MSLVIAGKIYSALRPVRDRGEVMSLSKDADAVRRYAAAEESIEAEIAFEVAAVIRQAEIERGVEIAGLRVNPAHDPRQRWAEAICTIAR
jgi:hypothetical protein